MNMCVEKTAYLGLGTNLGDRLVWLKEALTRLKGNPEIRINQISQIYETSPVGYLDQPSFYNLVCRIQTTLLPMSLLRCVQEIEQELKRERKIRWGPRTIDIDILLYEQKVIRSPELTIPHPRMQDRAFVLIPLFELAPQLVLPNTNQSIENLIKQLPPGQEIQRSDEQI